jgi:hypothetical protein
MPGRAQAKDLAGSQTAVQQEQQHREITQVRHAV